MSAELVRRLRPGVCLLAACLLLLATAGGAADADDHTPPQVQPAPAEAAPAKAPSPKDGSAETLALQKLVDAVRPEVARLRGLPWKHDVAVRVLSRDDLRAYMKAGLARDVTPAEWIRDDRIVRRLGMLRDDENLQDLVLLMLQEMVAGAYDPKTKELVLTAGFDGEGNLPTLVHELTHALEDQHFDLQALEKPYREDDPDRVFAIRCLFEGSAEWTRRRFQDLHPKAAAAYFQQRDQNKDAEAGQRRVFQRVPAHMLLSTLLHYRVGPVFVAQAVGADYPAGMHKLMADPPVSEEQILDPSKWLGPARDYPRKVVWGADIPAAFGKGWKKLDEHSVGEIDLAVYLDYFLGDKKGRLNLRTMSLGTYVDTLARRAAHGWDAGRALYVENGEGKIAVVEAFAFDSVADADDAARILGAALREANGAAWKGAGWVAAEDVSDHKAYDYVGAHGPGRILQRGREVLLLDGVPKGRFDAAWTALEKTTFTQDARDRGDDQADPFAGLDAVDPARGLGLKLPGADWEAIEGGRVPQVFAQARKGRVKVEFIVLDQGTTQAGLPRVGRMFLGKLFDPAQVTKTTAMGLDGIQHPLPAPEGWSRSIHIVSDAARSFAFLVEGPTDDLAASRLEVRRMLDGLPPIGAAATLPPPAGLRSLPGI